MLLPEKGNQITPKITNPLMFIAYKSFQSINVYSL